MKRAPIVLFVYRRPEHTRRTIESLRANAGASESDLIVYSDGPKTAEQAAAVQEVRSYLRGVDGFRSVKMVEREANMGLAASVIAGVSEVLERSPSVIVMEDDLVSAPNYLDFMNEALRVYRDRADVFSVTGYNYPLDIPEDYPEDAYLSYRGTSWGWGTWADRWAKVDWAVGDFDELRNSPERQALFARGGDDLYPMLVAQLEGHIDSWSIRFDYAHCAHNAFCLHPIRSKIQNIGFDGSGVHCEASDEHQVELDDGSRPFVLRPDLEADPLILRVFDARFRRGPEATGARPRSRFSDMVTAAMRFLRGARRP